MHRSRVTREGRKSCTTNAERELYRVFLNNWIRGIMIEDTISAVHRWQHPHVVSLYTFLRH